MGAGKIRDALPPLVEKVTASGAPVTWVCDPMHGNTYERRPATRPVASTTSSTRSRASSRCTAALGTVPGGIHVELTGDDVTECLGGSEQIDDADLDRATSRCATRG